MKQLYFTKRKQIFKLKYFFLNLTFKESKVNSFIRGWSLTAKKKAILENLCELKIIFEKSDEGRRMIFLLEFRKLFTFEVSVEMCVEE